MAFLTLFMHNIEFQSSKSAYFSLNSQHEQTINYPLPILDNKNDGYNLYNAWKNGKY